MKNGFKGLMILVLGGALTALSLGATAGCGSSGSSSSGGGSTTAVAQQEGALQLVSSLASLSQLGATGGGTALILGEDQAGLSLKESTSCSAAGSTTTCTCASGGSFSFSSSSTSGSFTFDHCDFGDGTAANGSFSISFSGSNSFSITYSSFTITVPSCGDFTIDGTISGSATSSSVVSLTFDITSSHGGTSSKLAGTLTVTNGASSTATLDGNLTTTNPTLSCTFSATPADCAHVAVACGLSASDVCTSSGDFNSTVCE